MPSVLVSLPTPCSCSELSFPSVVTLPGRISACGSVFPGKDCRYRWEFWVPWGKPPGDACAAPSRLSTTAGCSTGAAGSSASFPLRASLGCRWCSPAKRSKNRLGSPSRALGLLRLLPRQAQGTSLQASDTLLAPCTCSFGRELVVQTAPPEPQAENKEVVFICLFVANRLWPRNKNIHAFYLSKNKYGAVSYNPLGNWIWPRMWQLACY